MNITTQAKQIVRLHLYKSQVRRYDLDASIGMSKGYTTEFFRVVHREQPAAIIRFAEVIPAMEPLAEKAREMYAKTCAERTRKSNLRREPLKRYDPAKDIINQPWAHPQPPRYA